MWDNFVGRHIRRTNRNLLLTNVALLVVLGVLTLANGRYLVNFILGPFPAGESTLAALKAGQEPFEYFLNVKGTPAPESLGNQVKQTLDKYTRQVKSTELVAEYAVVPVGNRHLIVKVPGKLNAAQRGFIGGLAPIPPDLQAKTVQELKKVRVEFDDVFYPYMLDATEFRMGGYLALIFGLPLYTLLWFNVIRACRRMGRNERHPLVRSLAHYGTPAEVAQAIDAQVMDPGKTVRQSGIVLAPTWLLRPTTFGLDVIHGFDLVWIYKKVTKHSVNFIPTGTTMATVIHTRYGKCLEVNSGSLTEALLQQLFERAPWVVAGYSAQLVAMWKKDAASLVAAVDERRAQMFASVNPQPG